MRAVIYARYSSDLQSNASIDDQVHNCTLRVESEGWTLAEIYSDHAASGATMLRPGYQRLLMDARAGLLDIVVAEALDRLSRDQEDIAALYKQLTFAGVKLVTLAEGKIDELHIGLKGTMNALFLKDLAQKTHRGLVGRVRAGKSGGGRAFGYEVIRSLDDAGEPVRGEQRINDAEAAIVRRIFDEYVSGRSPRAIAITIIGNRKRGTGILNNRLYIGERVWNRLAYQRDPQTRKRVSRLNLPEQWIVTKVPQLTIIDEPLWNLAQTLQDTRSRDTRPAGAAGPDWRQRRPRHLFSGLIKCGCCGGGMSLVSRIYYGCSASRNKGTCTNRLTLRLDRLEETVLKGLQERLLTPELTETFVREYTAEVNRLRTLKSAGRHEATQRQATLQRQIANIVETVTSGRTSAALLDRLETLEKEKAELDKELGAPEPEPVIIHPNAASLYSVKVADLRDALTREGARDEAATILRGLVTQIRLHPVDGELQIELIGELATLLDFAARDAKPNKKPGFSKNPGGTESLVAGVGFEPTTFRL
jgi:site-specific DNA recombinase